MIQNVALLFVTRLRDKFDDQVCINACKLGS